MGEMPPATDSLPLTPLETCAAALRKRGFHVHCTPTWADAAVHVRALVDALEPRSVAYGDSMTWRATGLLEELKARPGMVFYDGFQPGMSREEKWEIRRQGMTADLFLTGVNACTEQGTLHWVDMVGNRVAPVAFGPRHVILLVGSNKIVPDAGRAAERLRAIAPLNARRHEGFRTPCVYTGTCADCNSPDRLCNIHMQIVKCFPPGRITVILAEEEGGL